MFTGIIEDVGIVVRLSSVSGAARLVVKTRMLTAGTRVGGSIAVNGVCLTATRVTSDEIEFDVSAETLRVTTLGALHSGDEINLERALRVTDRLGGHFVLGHVDGIGTIVRLERNIGQTTLEVTASSELINQLISKGSVALDGISLTVADLKADRFTVALIPQTLANTALRNKSAGGRVNLELDVIGKYVARLFEARSGQPPVAGRLSERFLEGQGFK